MDRIDGRAADQMRPLRFTPDYTRYAEGSVLVEMGHTRVLCNATVDPTLPSWLRNADPPQGWITATYNMLPRSTHTRTERETRGPSGRTQEIQRLIGRSLRACVDLYTLPSTQILVDCDVLQADGGTRTAAITGGYVAVALAIRNWAASQNLPLPTLTPIAAISVGLVDQTTCLDLCYEEDSQATTDFNVVMNAHGHYIELQGSAEQGGSFTHAQLTTMLSLANTGLQQLFIAQQQVLAGGQA